MKDEIDVKVESLKADLDSRRNHLFEELDLVKDEIRKYFIKTYPLEFNIS